MSTATTPAADARRPFTVQRIRQVKVPVTDLQRSVTWYGDLLGMELIREFVEEGELTGAVIANREAGFIIGLRLRSHIPGHPAMPGFDLFSLEVTGLDDLDDLRAHCDRIGATCGPIVDRGPDGHHLDVEDPDKTMIRFLTPPAADAPAFGGVEFDDDGRPDFYDTPRLHR